MMLIRGASFDRKPGSLWHGVRTARVELRSWRAILKLEKQKGESKNVSTRFSSFFEMMSW